MLQVLLMLFLQASAPSSAPEVAELHHLCKTVLCRPPRVISLKLQNGKPFRFEPTEPMPIVTGALITILPGETVQVEAKRTGDRLTDLAAVSTVVRPERTVIFTFRQEPSIGDGTGMILTVSSPFLGSLKYSLGMMRPEGEDIVGTSSCPARQNVPVVEHWPHPIFQLFVADMHFLDPGDKDFGTCK